MNLTATERSPGADGDRIAGGRRHQAWRPRARWAPFSVAAAVAVAFGALLRLWAPSPLWLDEAQAVAIARLPVPELLDALRQDGAPPLYYLLLHGWMRVFGTGDFAVRALSSLLALVTLPMAWRAGVYTRGRKAGAAALVLFATSPFAIRYATETRMYALVLLLAFAGLVLVVAPARPRPRRRLVLIGAVAGALTLTHYWAFILLAAAGLVLAWRVLRHRDDRDSPALLVALAAGALAFVPWIPAFLFQLQHTGAPWGPPPRMATIEIALRGFAGGDTEPGRLLMVLLMGIAGSALLGTWTGSREVGSQGRVLGLVTLITLLLGALVTLVTGDAFAARHASVAFPLLVLTVAAGVSAIQPPRPRRLLLAAAAVLGLAAGLTSVMALRTQAGAIAARLRQAEPHDIVVACPDQLAPALSRLLPDREMMVFPAGSQQGRINWTDYRARAKRAAPVAAARDLHASAGDGSVWLVWSPAYAELGAPCGRLHRELLRLRPEGRTVVRRQPGVIENAILWRGPPATGSGVSVASDGG